MHSNIVTIISRDIIAKHSFNKTYDSFIKNCMVVQGSLQYTTVS